MDGESLFLLNCTPDGGCYCNWRYTITGCFYEADYKIINIVCLVTVLLAGCVSGVLLYFRLARLGHTIYGRDEQGKIFPRMTESVALAVFFFCIAKTIHCIVLHVDAYPNVAFRICLFNIVYAIGVVGIAVATFAAMHIVNPNQYHLVIPWISPRALKILALFNICAPVIATVIFVPQAVYAQIGDLRIAYILETVRLIIWVIYTSRISLYIAMLCWRTTRLVKRHRSGLNANSIQAHRASELIRRIYLLSYSAAPALAIYALVDSFTVVIENTSYHQPNASNSRFDPIFMAFYQFAPSYAAGVACFFLATQRSSLLDPARLSSEEDTSGSNRRPDAADRTKPDDDSTHWGPAHTFSMSDSVPEGFYEELIQAPSPVNFTSQTHLTE